jgi:hypothetical protein
MSSQSGGDGYGKVKKNCQTGGASGWAKHCGSTDDHKKSNRIERKLGKQELEGEVPAPRMRGSRRAKVPTRRHLMDKYQHLKAELDKRTKERDAHLKKAGSDCDCWSFCRDRMGEKGEDWFQKWRRRQMEKLLEEFEKHGYERP